MPQHMPRRSKSMASSRSIWWWSISTSSRRSPRKADATLEELIENIDIGGPTMIRSAAKNWQDVAIVTSPADYAPILEELRAAGTLSRETKWRLAKKAFQTTADYDRAISARLAPGRRGTGTAARGARHPRAAPHRRCATARIRISRPRFMPPGRTASPGAEQLHGKELSYNNLVDLDAGLAAGLRVFRPRRGDHQAHQSRAAARSSHRWRKPIARPSNAIRFRRSAA